MSKGTLHALMRRGVDSGFARKLIDEGYTLSKLKQKKDHDLIELGFNSSQLKSFNDGRPPIPEQVVFKLLHESKFVCNVCRNAQEGVVIHHIVEWSISKSHKEENLIVLCPNHHDLAHTKKELTKNLTPKSLKEYKKEWKKTVLYEDAKLIKKLNMHDYSNWAYYNHHRVFKLFLKMNLPFMEYKTFKILKEKGLINSVGTFEIENHDRCSFYRFGEGYLLADYMTSLFNNLLINLPIIDITSTFNKKYLTRMLSPNTLIALQAAFYFKPINKKKWKGEGQERICYYKKNKVRIQFTIDGYESTSSSAHHSYLAGHSVITMIAMVTDIKNHNDNLIISVSCLAIGSYFNTHPSKEEVDNYDSYIDTNIDEINI